MATLSLGPVVMHGRQFTGPGFVFSKLTDWISLPDSKAPSIPIPQRHGNFDGGEDWSAAAIISVEGYIRGLTRAQAIQMQSELKRVRSLASLSTMRLDDPADAAGPTSRQVSVKRVKVSDIRNHRHVPFTIDVESPDPFRYGETVQSGPVGLPSLSGGLVFPLVFPLDFAVTGELGRIITPNAGEQPTASIFRVTGGLSGGFTLQSIEDGKIIRFEFPIGVDESVTIDTATGLAYLGSEDNNLSGFLTRSEFWEVPAADFSTVQFTGLGDVTGTPTLTGFTAPAYL